VWIFGKKESKEPPIWPLADMHSHLLPGIDDGAPEMADTLQMARAFVEIGYKKLIFTPHIMGDFYRNTPDIIQEKLTLVRVAFAENNISLETDAAAEYYVDEHFMHLLEEPDKLLTFGNKYILFEMSFMSISPLWKQAVFALQAKGFKPVLAHPERYVFLQESPSLLQEFVDRGIILQININSLSGYYSKSAQKMAENLIDNKLVRFAGSDCHRLGHLELMKQSAKSKYFQKLCDLPLLNNTLLNS
jgi:protein-tyrosine phosphatase